MDNGNKKMVTGFDISDKEYGEIVKKSVNSKGISDVEKQKLIKKISSLSCYEQELNKIVIPGYSNKVIFTDGNKQLVFENGEFFEASSTDATKGKVKLTRKEATDKYIEYYLNNLLNPLIAKKNEMGIEFKKKEVKEVQQEINSKLEVNDINKSKKIEEGPEL